jgi:hypothetical protein
VTKHQLDLRTEADRLAADTMTLKRVKNSQHRRLAPTVDSRFRGNDEREVIFDGPRALHPFYLTARVSLPDHCHNIPLRGSRDLWEVDGFIFRYSHGALQNRVK